MNSNAVKRLTLFVKTVQRKFSEWNKLLNSLFLLDLSKLKVRLESLFQHHDLHAKK